MSDWTLFSNHGHVLVCLARDPDARLRDVAAAVGITERAVQKIVRDLQHGGMLSVSKQGRRNQYRIHRKVGLRHSLEAGSNVGGLIDFVGGEGKAGQVTKTKTADKPQVGVVARDEEAERKAAEKRASDRIAAERKQTEKKAAEKKEAEKLAAEKKAAEKKAADKAKADAKSEVEKQQGSLF